MNQTNPDLEAQLIEEAKQNYHNEGINESSDRSHDYQQDDSRSDTSSTDFDASPRFNMVSIAISSCKIIASLVILSLISSPCTSISQMWVVCMLIHDIFNASIASMRLWNIYALKRANSSEDEEEIDDEITARDENNDNQREQELDNRAENDIRDEAGRQQEERVQTNDDPDSIADNIRKSMKRINVLSHVCIWYWAVLYVTGVCINTFLDLPGCTIPATDHLVFAYLLLASVWLFSPVLILIIGCISLPLIVFIAWIIERPKPANNGAIKKLPIIKYSPELPGEKECIICMIEYKEEDKIITLNCNSKHYYHEKCGKKWLKINGKCPICREKIDQIKGNSTS